MMKTKLAVLSGILNLILLFALLKLHSVPSNEAKDSLSPRPAKEMQQASLAPPEEVRIGIADWNEISSADFSQYVRNLRGLKCPEQLIHLMITSEIDSRYRA